MSRPARAPDRLVLYGRVRRAPGRARGGSRQIADRAIPKAIGAYGPLTDGKRARVFAFEALRPLKADMLVARVGGVSTREAAAALTGVEIFARRDQLPTPKRRRILLRRSHRPRRRRRRGRAAWPGRVADEPRRGRHSRDRAGARRRDRAPAVHQARRADASISTPGALSSSRRAKSKTKTDVAAHCAWGAAPRPFRSPRRPRAVAKGAGGG